jgi:hypothetical protein
MLYEKAKLSTVEYNKVLKNLESNSHGRKTKQKICHGRKQRQKHSHGLTRKEAEAET